MSLNPAFQRLASSKLAFRLVQRCHETLQRCLMGPPSASEVGYSTYSPEMVQRSERVIREAAKDPGLFDPEYDVTSEADTSGDPQISYDRICHEEAHEVAALDGAALFGEEDQYRSMGAEGPNMRGDGIRQALAAGNPFGVLDAIDGTHQFAAMYQPGAFGSVALVIDEQARASTAIALGTGIVVHSDGHHVWKDNLADPLDQDGQELVGQSIARRSHYALNWLMPAYKPDRLAAAGRVAEWAINNSDKVAPPALISPLGGNPGIISSMVLAPGGAVAAYQPKSWAWDQIAAHICATLGFTVISAASGKRYLTKDIIEMLLRDLGAGAKTEALVIGKTFLDAQAMRTALIGSGVVTVPH